MGHDHDHHHGDRSQFYMEQILTIAVCAAFAGVTLILWYSGTLKNLLAVKFHIWVLLGGAGLLLMAVVNAVAVWFSVGDAKAVPVNGHDHDHDHENGQVHAHDHHHHDHCDHDHDHAHEHGHVHAHGRAHGHETGVQAAHTAAPSVAVGVQQEAPPAAAAPVVAHDHTHSHDGHSHGWAPWRYAVLLLPVAMYLVFPLDALSSTGGNAIDVDASAADAKTDQKGEDFSVTFQQLELAALYPENRDLYEGKTVRLVGQCVPRDNRMFTLRRFKISCCAADAVPLNAVILIDPKSAETLDANRLEGKWVQVTGRVEFLKRSGSGAYTTTLIVAPTADRALAELVKEVPPPASPYLN